MKNLAPRLRHRVAIQQQTQEQASDSDIGEIVLVWSTYAGLDDVPAEIVPMSGRELMAANARQYEAKVRATIRYVPGILTTMRLVHDGLNYNILDVQPDPTFRRHLTLMLSEGLTDGQ